MSLSTRSAMAVALTIVALFAAVSFANEYQQLCGTVTVTQCSPTRWYFYNVRLRDTLTTKNALGIELISGPGGATVTPAPGHVLYTGGICQPLDADQCNEYGQAGRACGPDFGGFTGGCRKESSTVFVTTGVAGTLDWKIGVRQPQGVLATNCSTNTCDFKLSVWLTHGEGSVATCEELRFNGTDETDKANTNPCPPAGTSFASAGHILPAAITMVMLFVVSSVLLLIV
eukprot:TRINITY_DN15631_c0_g1_i1.p1 TRINITY_DN15631_c0_g1~~TRINITY_DN15631_c0_g1_i1.p1  ORF type:complete len:229 (+),score=35.02 TRINITY_DN15631_c0_g1_i1:344-1030(+)